MSKKGKKKSDSDNLLNGITTLQIPKGIPSG